MSHPGIRLLLLPLLRRLSSPVIPKSPFSDLLSSTAAPWIAKNDLPLKWAAVQLFGPRGATKDKGDAARQVEHQEEKEEEWVLPQGLI